METISILSSLCGRAAEMKSSISNLAERDSVVAKLNEDGVAFFDIYSKNGNLPVSDLAGQNEGVDSDFERVLSNEEGNEHREEYLFLIDLDPYEQEFGQRENVTRVIQKDLFYLSCGSPNEKSDFFKNHEADFYDIENVDNVPLNVRSAFEGVDNNFSYKQIFWHQQDEGELENSDVVNRYDGLVSNVSFIESSGLSDERAQILNDDSSNNFFTSFLVSRQDLDEEGIASDDYDAISQLPSKYHDTLDNRIARVTEGSQDSNSFLADHVLVEGGTQNGKVFGKEHRGILDNPQPVAVKGNELFFEDVSKNNNSLDFKGYEARAFFETNSRNHSLRAAAFLMEFPEGLESRLVQRFNTRQVNGDGSFPFLSRQVVPDGLPGGDTENYTQSEMNGLLEKEGEAFSTTDGKKGNENINFIFPARGRKSERTSIESGADRRILDGIEVNYLGDSLIAANSPDPAELSQEWQNSQNDVKINSKIDIAASIGPGMKDAFLSDFNELAFLIGNLGKQRRHVFEVEFARENLGKLKVTLSRDGHSKLTIVAHNANTYEMLWKNVDLLQDELRASGVEVNSLDFLMEGQGGEGRSFGNTGGSLSNMDEEHNGDLIVDRDTDSGVVSEHIDIKY